MAQEALLNALKEYNSSITNKFHDNWGSLLSFIEGEDTEWLTRKVTGDIKIEQKNKNDAIFGELFQRKIDVRPAGPPLKNTLIERVQLMKSQPSRGETANHLKQSYQNQTNAKQLARVTQGSRHQSANVYQKRSTYDNSKYQRQFSGGFSLQPSVEQNQSRMTTEGDPLTHQVSKKLQGTVSDQMSESGTNPHASKKQTVLSADIQMGVGNRSVSAVNSNGIPKQLVPYYSQTGMMDQEFNPEEIGYVYKSHKKYMKFNPQKRGLSSLNERRFQQNGELRSPQSSANLENVKPIVQTRHRNASTCASSGQLQKAAAGDPNPAIENATLVPHSNVLQHAVLAHVKKEQKAAVNHAKGSADQTDQQPGNNKTGPPVNKFDTGNGLNRVEQMYNQIQQKGQQVKGIRNETDQHREKGTIQNRPQKMIRDKNQKQYDLLDDQALDTGLQQQKLYGQNKNTSAKMFLKQNATKRWMSTHQTKTKANENQDSEQPMQQRQRKNIEFARDLFISWDDNGDGKIDESEIVKPLVSLGLAPDSKFAKKICQALDPRSKHQKARGDEIQLTVDEFIKIFKSDKISEQLMRIIDRESEKRAGNMQKAVEPEDMPSSRLQHPERKNLKLTKEDAINFGIKQEPQVHEIEDNSQRVMKNLSISMRDPTKKSIVEVPLDDPNHIILHQDFKDEHQQRRIRNSQSFRIKEEKALRSPHVVELYQRETPRYQKLANEFQKARQRGPLEDSKTNFTLSDRRQSNHSQAKSTTLSKNIMFQAKQATQEDQFSQVEQFEQIRNLWFSLVKQNVDSKAIPDIRTVTELPVKVIQDYLVKEGIAQDREKAREVIHAQAGDDTMDDNRITMQEFEKLFCKGIFKRALSKIAETFDYEVKCGNIPADLPLSRKLDTLQRKDMIKGINPKARNHVDIRKRLDSLRDLWNSNDPNSLAFKITYEQFLKDPFAYSKQLASERCDADDESGMQLAKTGEEVDKECQGIKRFIEYTQPQQNQDSKHSKSKLPFNISVMGGGGKPRNWLDKQLMDIQLKKEAQKQKERDALHEQQLSFKRLQRVMKKSEYSPGIHSDEFD